MPKSQNKRKKSRSGKNRTHLQDHKKVGKQLQSGFAVVADKVTFSSWSNERLPEMIWAAIIRVIDDQDYAIEEFRRILSFIGEHDEKDQFSDISLTGISKLPEALREQFIGFILENKTTASALVVLSLFDNLPAKETWVNLLPKDEPDISILMDAVGFNLPHQSQEATDCRWLKLMAQVISGKFHVPRVMAEEWFGYPYEGDVRKIRPSIRASEMAENPLIEKDLTWPNAFWDEAWRNSPCLALMEEKEPTIAEAPFVSRADVTSLLNEIESHWSQTHTTTAIDARHDAVFGLALYVVKVLDEMLGIGIGTGILGRLGLRTILEAHISLRYLLHKDDPELWKKWRAYGAGQAKLNALRFDELMDPPKHINQITIEAIAGEDHWEEFLNIELGSWSGLDLRKISEKTGVKDAYDAHYSWTSGYSHGTWGPVRESCFETCGNPLHRLHRYPKQQRLPDTISDACLLVNSILDDLDKSYPGFSHRIPDAGVGNE
ncbi:MAG: hypothetical protein CL578_18600 [Alteromonadaceae bacterium]|jgi:hypothetical protein|uniref:DUF5677 domain-containing protein n=1 Tax=unclassified Methylophaga TaxID=2629249 RepID=UPI000C420E75|nr:MULTISPECIES: DUF5677 domain-containing protein [unclassified Methylophaga]MAP25491.1 hypothetical protein [Methylophaga sp.]MBN27039.1 hypothetical protein [Alteromonadaceae bacterium]|tara:strand:+ start:23371 stop:24843 length:1473 start_codon:yes stop_codon:yes gene_type:complete